MSVSYLEPAGVISVGYRSDISPLIFPPNNVVFPARMLTATVTMKATTFVPCKKADFFNGVA